MGAAELGPWEPLRLDAVGRLLEAAPFRWWIAGGHALEMHLGRSWRTHEDTDIGIVRSDAPALRVVLAGWDIHLASDGVLTPWDGRPVVGSLSNVGNLWCRRSTSEPWSLDVLIGEGNQHEWIYKRDRSIRRPWSEVVLQAEPGLPCLAPEVQLLFKSRNVRPKDGIDAVTVIPALTPERRAWLAGQLPHDHPWQLMIEHAGDSV